MEEASGVRSVVCWQSLGSQNSHHMHKSPTMGPTMGAYHWARPIRLVKPTL